MFEDARVYQIEEVASTDEMYAAIRKNQFNLFHGVLLVLPGNNNVLALNDSITTNPQNFQEYSFHEVFEKSIFGYLTWKFESMTLPIRVEHISDAILRPRNYWEGGKAFEITTSN